MNELTRDFCRYVGEMLRPPLTASGPFTRRNMKLFGVEYDLILFVGSHVDMQKFIGNLMRAVYTRVGISSFGEQSDLHQWFVDTMHAAREYTKACDATRGRYPTNCLVVYPDYVLRTSDHVAAYDYAFKESQMDTPTTFRAACERSDNVYVTSERELLEWQPPICVLQLNS